jgi:PIN domain nuclease of toxin-antitoxin system
MNRDDFGAQAPTIYVTDTHVLYWYLRHSALLSDAAQAVFRLAETGNALIVVPAIVVAEFYFVSVKLQLPFPLSELFRTLDGLESIYFSDLGRVQLEKMDVLTEIPEMHDRLIAAEALVLNAPVVTKDPVFTRSPHIRTIW